MSILTRSGKPSDFDATMLELTDVSPALAARASSGLTAVHHLGGWCGVDDGGAAVVAFQLDHGAAALPPPARPRFWLDPISKFSLGYGLRLIARDGKTMISQAWFRHDDLGLRALLDRRVATMLFFRSAALVGAVAAVWTGTDQQLDEVKLTRRLMRDAPLPLPASFGSLGDSFFAPELLTIHDRAAAARFYGVDVWCRLWAVMLKQDRSQILDVASHAPELPEPIASAVATLRSGRNPMPALAALAEAEWREHRVRRLFQPWAPQLEIVRTGLLLLAVASEAATQGGTRVACLGYGGEPAFVPLDLAAIERHGGPAGLLSYWRCIVGSTTYLWDRVLTGAEMPAWPPQVAEAFLEAALVTDPHAARATASDLIHEAVRECQGSIPYGATVELRVGPFTHANVYAFANVVLFQCWTTSNEFVMLCAWLGAGTVSNLAAALPTPEQSDLLTRMEATLAVMLAAIVRDFWVTEHRERVFATRVERASPRRPGRSVGAPTVVYLPRVRYAHAPDLERGARELRLVERRTHDVAPHLRRAAHASAEQLALAAIYGMTVPDGFTYVRAHRRGTREVDVLYRSRSAMQAIYEPRETLHDEAAAGWFRFEAAVRDYVRTQQLSIERWTSMVDGIEILATAERGEGMCLVHAFDRERIGAGHVDALVQRRADAPSHVPLRAILFVRGDASPSAVKRGAEVGIEIIGRIVESAPR